MQQVVLRRHVWRHVTVSAVKEESRHPQCLMVKLGIGPPHEAEG